jgi:hypothetical protein
VKTYLKNKTKQTKQKGWGLGSSCKVLKFVALNSVPSTEKKKQNNNQNANLKEQKSGISVHRYLNIKRVQ